MNLMTTRDFDNYKSLFELMTSFFQPPDLLIYLHASFTTSTARRALDWTEKDYLEQLRRLAHAREHAHLIIETDALTPNQILQIALDFLHEHSA